MAIHRATRCMFSPFPENARFGHGMIIDVIDDIAQFDQLRPNWDAVYGADVNGPVLFSWPWLRASLTVTPNRWFVLTLRPDAASSNVAFLPLASSVVRRLGIAIERGLHMGGNPLADFTGMLCLPECEELALTSFSGHVQDRLVWDRFCLSDVYDPRLQAFLQLFPSRRFTMTNPEKMPCPYIPLPLTWEEYLSA